MNASHSLDLERTARRRAGMKLGWYLHATVYIAVNLGLVALAMLSGRSWAVFPVFGWGLGLAIHGLVVFVIAGGGIYRSLVERERQQLAAQKDPW